MTFLWYISTILLWRYVMDENGGGGDLPVRFRLPETRRPDQTLDGTVVEQEILSPVDADQNPRQELRARATSPLSKVLRSEQEEVMRGARWLVGKMERKGVLNPFKAG